MTVRRSFAAAIVCAGLIAVAVVGAPASAAQIAATYATYQAPGALGSDAYEPSIGVSWKSGAVFLQAGLQTLKVDFDQAGQASWSDVSSLQTSITSADPILYSDVKQGRVFVSQLTGFDSLSAFTDDDGKTYTPSQGGGIPSGVDHQSLGSGPYPANSVVKALTSFPNAVYYCSQQAATAFCARSDNGGITFGAGVPIYTIDACGGLHGHVRVSPDGTVYVPNKNCNGKQGVAVSRDAGLTWTLHTVPGSVANTYIVDPSLSAGSDNTAYLGFVGADGQPKVTVTRDHGESFTPPIDVGAPLGIANATFPEVIAGDGDRAAFAFLGTKTDGISQRANFGIEAGQYTGADYRLYISTTIDRGAHWTTVDVTGNDPVQRGRICNIGTTCTTADRNLADFMDIQVDQQGRVLVGYPDGCVLACITSTAVKDNTFAAKGSIARQVSGPLLFAASVAKPATATPTAGSPGRGVATPPRAAGGGLAATGSSPALALLAVSLLGAVLVVRRPRLRLLRWTGLGAVPRGRHTQDTELLGGR